MASLFAHDRRGKGSTSGCIDHNGSHLGQIHFYKHPPWNQQQAASTLEEPRSRFWFLKQCLSFLQAAVLWWSYHLNPCRSASCTSYYNHKEVGWPHSNALLVTELLSSSRSLLEMFPWSPASLPQYMTTATPTTRKASKGTLKEKTLSSTAFQMIGGVIRNKHK